MIKGWANRFVARPFLINRLLIKSFLSDCSKMPGCKAPEILRSEAYSDVRRNDEG